MPALAGNHSEEDCLVLAANIRTVLTAMVERMAEAVKDGKKLMLPYLDAVAMGRVKL